MYLLAAGINKHPKHPKRHTLTWLVLVALRMSVLWVDCLRMLLFQLIIFHYSHCFAPTKFYGAITRRPPALSTFCFVFCFALPATGRPGTDYPILASIPYTNFYCDEQEYPGFFADMDTRCQGKAALPKANRPHSARTNVPS